MIFNQIRKNKNILALELKFFFSRISHNTFNRTLLKEETMKAGLRNTQTFKNFSKASSGDKSKHHKQVRIKSTSDFLVGRKS